MIPLRKATKEQKLELYEQIMYKLLESGGDDMRVELLPRLIELLDELDEDDFFGTEGWKHYFGFED